MGFDTFEQALWCTIVTMSTVGYGDVYPVSLPGRMIMTLGGIIGGLLVSGLITTVFVDLAILTEVRPFVSGEMREGVCRMCLPSSPSSSMCTHNYSPHVHTQLLTQLTQSDYMTEYFTNLMIL